MKNTIKLAYILFFYMLLTVKGYAELSKTDINLAQHILNKFSAIPIQMSDFVQRSANGHLSHGTFYMLRPDKIRFVFTDTPLNVVSDGTSVLINNTMVDSWNLYPLNKTPMKILLAKHIKASGGYLHAVLHRGKEIILVFKNNDNSNSAIYMNFNSTNYKLKRWTIIDEQSMPTTVEILNAKHDIRFDKDMFTIPYQSIAMKRKR